MVDFRTSIILQSIHNICYYSFHIVRMLYKSKLINTYTHNYHNFLVFNAYQLYNSVNSHQIIKVKKIQSRDCNKITMEKVLLKNIKINPDIFHITQNHKIYIKNIIKLLQKLRTSGYIASIKIFNINTKDDKYITLDLRMNPTVKIITILDYKNLKIPSNFLKHLFKKQIGMPKNYKLINNSLKSIYLWYKSRGFAWVNIQLIEQEVLDSSSISLKIMEGTVKDVKLSCQTHNIHNSKLVSILDLLIKKELNIYPGSILNIKKIEAGIRHLTNLNLIEDCNYIIKRNKTNLIVIIKYSILKNHIDYFYNYSSILENCSNYKNVLNLLNKSLANFNFFSQYIIYLQKFYIYSSIIKIDQHIGFTYKSFYSKKYIDNISVNLTVIQDYPQLNIIFSHPYIYKQKKMLSHLIINLYNKMIKSYLCHPFILLQFNGLNKSQKSNLLTYLYNSIFLFKHNLIKNINILGKGWAIYNKYSKINIYIKDYQVNQSDIKKSLLKTQIFNTSKLLKYIIYQLMYLQISIRYNNIYFWDQLKAGKLLKIHSQLFTYISRSYNNAWYQLFYLGQNIGIKYIQVFNLPKIFTYIYYHSLIIFSECHFLINSYRYSPILYQSYNNKQIYFKGNHNKNFPPYFFYLFNIEYHISKFKHLSMYFFWNYIIYLYSQKQHKLYINTINHIYIYEMSIGAGIKFYIPIKKLPNIRLEYSIDNKGECFLGLRTESKYNE